MGIIRLKRRGNQQLRALHYSLSRNSENNVLISKVSED